MNPPTGSSPASLADAEKAAARWLARRDAGLSAAEETEFERWYAAAPQHRAAWAELMLTWEIFDEPRESGAADAMVRELAMRQHRRRWKKSIAIAAGFTAAAAAVVVAMVMRPGQSSPASPDSHAVVQTGPTAASLQRALVGAESDRAAQADRSHGIVLRTEQRTLEDGSVVALDQGAKIEVAFAPDRRSVRLLQGEALFTVAKNAARPFIVSTSGVDVQAVGTAFAVKANANGVDVVVTEGRVAVGRKNTARERPAAAADPVLVGAGDRVVVPAIAAADEHLQVETLATEEMARRLAWLGPRLQLAATQLEDAATLFNHENRIQLHIEDSQLARLQLSGVFRADDPEGFVRLLVANYSVKATRNGDVIELRGN